MEEQSPEKLIRKNNKKNALHSIVCVWIVIFNELFYFQLFFEIRYKQTNPETLYVV